MTAHDPDVHHRRSIRLREYDYSQSGAYFFTACTYGRACLFGEVRDGVMHLSEFGGTIQACWMQLPQHYIDIRLDAFIVMPNHVHGIIILGDTVAGSEGQGRAGLRPAPTIAANSDASATNSDVSTRQPTPTGSGRLLDTTLLSAVTDSGAAAPAVGAGLRPALPSRSHNGQQLFEIIRAFKSFSSRAINEARRTPGLPVWQRGYFERVIRDEDGLRLAREYVYNNPLRWSVDRDNPDFTLQPARTTHCYDCV